MTDAYTAGRLDPVDLSQAALAAAGRESMRNVLITTTPGRALHEARASRARYQSGRPRGPLDGVPVVWKDMFDIAGTRTTAGSATRLHTPVAAADAPVVQRLAQAGAVCLGKTNLSEFAFSGLGTNQYFGTPANPHSGSTARIPGGSSSGSAVAVAGGLVPVAIGTDTSGSVRVPAALCGVIGFKASADRYDRAGMYPLSPMLDSVGVFARQMRDIVAVDAALRAGPVRHEPSTTDRPVNIVVPHGELIDDCDHDVRAAFAKTIAVLADTGFQIVSRRIASLDRAQQLMDSHGTLVAHDAYQRHGHLVDGQPNTTVDPAVIRRLSSFRTTDSRIEAVRGELPTLRRQLRAELAGAVLAFPSVRGAAPEIQPLLADPEAFDTANLRLLRSTMLASYLGLPGVALPAGTGEDGLPVSILLSVPSGEDDRLLHVAALVESASNAGGSL